MIMIENKNSIEDAKQMKTNSIVAAKQAKENGIVAAKQGKANSIVAAKQGKANSIVATKQAIESSIAATKQAFENSFSSGDFYNKQTQDEQHLKLILMLMIPVSLWTNICSSKMMVILSFIQRMNGNR